MLLPKPLSRFHLLSKCDHWPKPPTNNVPGDCAAADPPRSNAAIAQRVELLLNMMVFLSKGGYSPTGTTGTLCAAEFQPPATSFQGSQCLVPLHAHYTSETSPNR